MPLLVTAIRDGDLSADLATVVRRLLAVLDPVARSVVEAAAVLGEQVADDPLAAVTGCAVEAALTCLDRSVDAADAADALGLGELVALSALVLQGVTYSQAGQVLRRLCRRALTFDLPPALRARVLAQSASVEADDGRVDHADPLAREAVAVAASSGDGQAQIEAARAREMTLVHADDNVKRLRLGDLVADRAESLGQPVAAIIGHSWRIRSAYELGRLDIVESATDAVARLASRARLPLANWHLYRLLSSRSALLGQFADSVEYSQRATAIAEASGDRTAVGMFFAHGTPAWPAVVTQMVTLITRFNDTETADVAYRQLLPFRRHPGAFGSPTVYFTGSISRHLGELAVVIGDTTLAGELLREALERNRVLGPLPDVAQASLDLARLLRDPGSSAKLDAERAAHDAFSIATKLGMPGTAAAAAGLMTALAADRHHADPLTAR